ncbi:hypothetical protein BGP79_00520 [Tersicoccus sp. Bi-70]|nr:hypothetical protein BGP79_00520 [Tersicoccus sp. Bi-70]
MPIADDDASDGQLISAVRAGDRRAFGVLYERHRDAAWRVARRSATSAAQADDLVAEAFANTLAAIRRGAGPRDNVRAYLVTIVAHEAARAARSTRGQYSTEAIELAEVPQVFDDPVLKSFDAETIRRAFLTLPERSRTVLWYAAVEGLKPAAIGPLVGLSPNAASVALRRARDRLAEAYLQCHVRAVQDQQCRVVGPSLGAFAAGRLRGPALAVTRTHVESCLSCSAAVLHLRDVNRGLRAAYLPLAAVAASSGSGLLAALGIGSAAVPTARSGRWGLAAFGPGGSSGAAAVTTAVVVVGVAAGIGVGRLVTAEPAPAAIVAAAAPVDLPGALAGGVLDGRSGALPSVPSGSAGAPGVVVSGSMLPSSGLGDAGGGLPGVGLPGGDLPGGVTGDGSGVWSPDVPLGQDPGLLDQQPPAGVIPGFPGSGGGGDGRPDGTGALAPDPGSPGIAAPSVAPSSVAPPRTTTPVGTPSVPRPAIPPTASPTLPAPSTTTTAPLPSTTVTVTASPTTAPPTTAPPTTVPPTTAPPTTPPPTSLPPTTAPPTTAPPTSAPPTVTAPPTTVPSTGAVLGVRAVVAAEGRFWQSGPVDGVATARITVTAPIAESDRRLTLQFRPQDGWLVVRRPASMSDPGATAGATSSAAAAAVSASATPSVTPSASSTPTLDASGTASASATAGADDRLTADQARAIRDAHADVTASPLMTSFSVDLPARRGEVTVDIVAVRVSAVPAPSTVPAVPWVLTDLRDGATARGELPVQERPTTTPTGSPTSTPTSTPSGTATSLPTSSSSGDPGGPTLPALPTITASLFGQG